MTAAGLYAFVTFGVGFILLLAWLYATSGNGRSAEILLKSFFLFVLPGAILIALPPEMFRFPLSMWILVLIEESLKVVAARTERNGMNRFWLVALFGIWELMLAKPLWGLRHGAFLEDWTNLQLAGLTVAGIVTVLMHSVTAEIYAFRFGDRLTIAFAVSWALHTSFNESISLFGVSLLTCLVAIVPLTLILVALWPKRLVSPQSSSSS